MRLPDPNPVLVKEVRQALRGRYFKNSFAVTLCLTTFAGVVAVLVATARSAGDETSQLDAGLSFFLAVSAAVSLGTLGLVPFSAFSAMSAEAEENTLDLLLLSSLSPRTIVLGKLGSALVQALLLYTTLLPFLMVAFLLQGVGLGDMLALLGLSGLATIAFSSLGIALSLAARTRWARVVLMMLFGFVLFFYLVQAHVGGLFVMFAGMGASRTLVTTGQALGAIAYVVLAAYSVAFACARLAHAEANGSTPARVVTAALVAIAFVLAAFGVPGTTAGPQSSLATLITTMIVIALPLATFATEREGLGKAVAPTVPPRRARALCAAPFLPGGGRGSLFLLLVLAATVGFAFVVFALRHPVGGGEPTAVGILAAYFVIWTLLPARLFARWSSSAYGRGFARIAVIAFAGAAFLVPTIARTILGSPGSPLDHLGNPFYLIESVMSRHEVGLSSSGTIQPVTHAARIEMTGELMLLLAVLSLTLLLNAPRIVRGVREVLDASAANRRLAGEATETEVARAVAEA